MAYTKDQIQIAVGSTTYPNTYNSFVDYFDLLHQEVTDAYIGFASLDARLDSISATGDVTYNLTDDLNGGGNYKCTNMAVGTANTDYATVGQISGWEITDFSPGTATEGTIIAIESSNVIGKQLNTIPVTSLNQGTAANGEFLSINSSGVIVGSPPPGGGTGDQINPLTQNINGDTTTGTDGWKAISMRDGADPQDYVTMKQVGDWPITDFTSGTASNTQLLNIASGNVAGINKASIPVTDFNGSGGSSGLFLTTDGTSTSWASPPTGSGGDIIDPLSKNINGVDSWRCTNMLPSIAAGQYVVHEQLTGLEITALQPGSAVNGEYIGIVNGNVAGVTAPTGGETARAYTTVNNSNNGDTIAAGDSLYILLGFTSWQMNLPTTPAEGDRINFFIGGNANGSSVVTLNGNGNELYGSAFDDLIIDSSNHYWAFTLIYILYDGWQLIEVSR